MADSAARTRCALPSTVRPSPRRGLFHHTGGILRPAGLQLVSPLSSAELTSVVPSSRISSMRKRSVSNARWWMDAFRLSINCELIDGCIDTRSSAAREAGRITGKDVEKRAIALRRLRVLVLDDFREQTGQAVERLQRALEEVAQPRPRGRRAIVEVSLSRVGEEELVASLRAVPILCRSSSLMVNTIALAAAV